MSSKFKKILPLLLNVPQFDGIRIHSGNVVDNKTFIKKIKIDKNRVFKTDEFTNIV